MSTATIAMTTSNSISVNILRTFVFLMMNPLEITIVYQLQEKTTIVIWPVEAAS